VRFFTGFAEKCRAESLLSCCKVTKCSLNKNILIAAAEEAESK
jgi:hypothetical protein